MNLLPQLRDWRPVEALYGHDAQGCEWLRLGQEFWVRLDEAASAVVFGWLIAGLCGFLWGLLAGWLKWGVWK